MRSRPATFLGRWWLMLVAKTLHMIFPGTERVPGLDPERGLPFLRTFCAQSPATMRLALHVSAFAFLITTPLTVRSLRPAHRLAPAVAARHTTACAEHRIYLLRQAVLMLKTTGGFCWGADPEVRRSLGVAAYPADPLSAEPAIQGGREQTP